MKPVPHGEPYAGKLRVRFDEGYPPKTAKSVLRVAEGRAGVPDNKGRPALLYTLLGPNDPRRRNRQAVLGSRFKVKFVRPSSKG